MLEGKGYCARGAVVREFEELGAEPAAELAEHLDVLARLGEDGGAGKEYSASGALIAGLEAPAIPPDDPELL
jgi:hypothetical protein